MANSHNQIFTLASSSMIVGVFVLFIYLPQRKEIILLRQQNAQKRQDSEIRALNVSSAPVIESELNHQEELSRQLDKQVPVSDMMGELLESISSIANDLRLRNKTVIPLPPYTTKGVHVLPIQMGFNSDCDSVCEFLHTVESQDRIVRVSEIDLQVKDNDPLNDNQESDGRYRDVLGVINLSGKRQLGYTLMTKMTLQIFYGAYLEGEKTTSEKMTMTSE